MTSRAASWILGLVFLAGCRGGDGRPCILDSDCVPGLVCGLDGLCQTRASVDRSFHPPDGEGGEVAPVPDASAEVEAKAETSGEAVACGPQGIFEAGAAPCPAPAEKKKVTSLVLPEEGHGMAQLATLANPVIANGFSEGKLHYEAWVDGTYSAACGPVVAWMREGKPDRNPNCTPVWLTEFPFAIPGLVQAKIYEAVLDPATSRLSGIADEQEILDSMDPSLRGIADGLLTEDVDTDGDQVPDMISVLIDVGFE